MIVCRPRTGERKILQNCQLNSSDGLLGDNWKQRGQWKAPDKPANVDMQLNLMNLRAITAIAADQAQWPLAGDQFYVDLDLSQQNLPAGTRLMIGTAVIEVTAEPHLGCRKFAERFGRDAVTFVNSNQGKRLNLRGINAKVISAGQVSVGDEIHKL
jgi:MOSC domain-containing protein YiiM